MSEYLNIGNFACEIFDELQKTFDKIDRKFLLSKLVHYGVRGVANIKFKNDLCMCLLTPPHCGFQ